MSEVRKSSFDEAATKAIDLAISNSRVFAFIRSMQGRLMREDENLTARDAWRMSQKALRSFLRGEEVEFGDKRFDWGRDAAEVLAEEWIINYWEYNP